MFSDVLHLSRAAGLSPRDAGITVASATFVDSRRLKPSARRNDTWRVPFLLTAILVTLLGAAVRWGYLDYPMRYDESWNHLRFGSRSLWHIVTHYEPNNHVLHTLFARVTVAFLGTSPAAVRLPSFVAGVALIPLTGWLAWSLFHRRGVVLLAMLAAAGSSPLIEYSANSRGYSMMGVFAALAAICTLHLARDPAKRRLWALWGVLGALGVYSHASMIYPMAALSCTLFLQALRGSRAGIERRPMVLGLCLGVTVWIVVTSALFLPALTTQSVAGIYRALTTVPYDVYRAWLELHGSVPATVWQSWVRHTNTIWQIVLIAGFAAFVISALRRPVAGYVVPFALFLILPIIVLVQNVPLVPPGWIFALPLFLACSMYGASVWVGLISQRILRRVASVVSILLIVVSGGLSLATASRQPYLSVWEHELVDIEPILDECESYGTQRCSLIVQFTPSYLYYIRERGMDHPLTPDSGDAQRVYIAATTLKSLSELWHKGVSGFARYDAPRVWKKFSRSTLYVAKRIKHADVERNSAPSLVAHRP
ncbi:MAG: hypothetical protein IIB60_02080 [Planctomycetes bacterium]|nr:hypothetical protein [Planctomycetota bacterium]